LKYLTNKQKEIEKRLYETRKKSVTLFLYDVTSSYLEGQENELGDWGYNRDRKKGKKQVVVGLLCDEEGGPVSIEVFKGNTTDPKTFLNQLEKVKKEYKCENVTFVGDRGMIKKVQKESLEEAGYYYITAITKKEIGKLIKEKVINMELFDKELCEIICEGKRYIMRRNPYRAEEIKKTKEEKKEKIEKLIKKQNKYLVEHKKAKEETALKEIEKWIEKLKVSMWLKAEKAGRKIILIEDKAIKEEESKLDGCYVLTTDLPKKINKEKIHERYKDLTEVERGFRTMKTTVLEMRPWYVRRESSTRGHALVVMLAYYITRELQKMWKEFDLTVEEGLKRLSMLCTIDVKIGNNATYQQIPQADKLGTNLLEEAGVIMPHVLHNLGANVVSRKKLPSQRKRY